GLVCDTARNMLLDIELFADKELEPADKFQILLAMLFPEPEKAIEAAGESLDDLIACVLWDACGLDVTGTKPHERAVFDWESDAPRIQASFMSAYGITWDQAADGLSFADVCALLGELVEDDGQTPFAQAIYYRTAKPPRRTKYNGEQCDAWSARRSHFALKAADASPADAMEEQNNRSRDLFAALKAVAKGAEVGNV
ncbi:MAG: Gp15 family bacteriophage protein, partial [Gordonibacter urolithinfaciens]